MSKMAIINNYFFTSTINLLHQILSFYSWTISFPSIFLCYKSQGTTLEMSSWNESTKAKAI